MAASNKKTGETELKDREREILDVAAQLFAQDGFEAVPVRTIAESVGLAKGTLYHYFKDKESIYARIVIVTMEKLCRQVEEKVGAGPTARERLLLYMEENARFFEDNIWASTAMLLGLGGVQQPQEREKAAYWRDRHEHNLRQILSEGIERGEFRPVDVAVAGRAILSTLNWMGRWYKPEGPTRATEFARQYADLFISGLVAGP